MTHSVDRVSPDNPVTDILAAQNMQRLLEVYRTLAPLTIGGPASTTLETAPNQLLPPHSNTGAAAVAGANRPPASVAGLQDSLQAIRRFSHYPWLLGAAFNPALQPNSQHPPPQQQQQQQQQQQEEGRRRHSSCSSLAGQAVVGGVVVPGPPPTPSSPPSYPMFSPKDRESSSLLETTLEGRRISCFSVGGELRLCLTQILQLVLPVIPLPRIHQACDELQIFCSTSSPTQLTSLKLARVLPISAPQCGLITKSDAERLCSLLLHSPGVVVVGAAAAAASLLSSPSRTSPTTVVDAVGSLASPSQYENNNSTTTTTTTTTTTCSSPAVSPPRTGDPSQFRVQHLCFGRCVGLLHPQSFTRADSPCIECTECTQLFSPAKFVCHTHQPPDRGIVHWGFSRDNWPTYIQVWEEYEGEEKDRLEKELASLKRRAAATTPPSSPTTPTSTIHSSKRKLVGDGEVPLGGKRWREEEAAQYTVPQFPGLDKVVFPPLESRFPVGWSLPPPQQYLQSLAQLHSIKLLLEHQSAAVRSLHQAPQYSSTPGVVRPDCPGVVRLERVVEPLLEPGQTDYVRGVALVLAGAGVSETSRVRVVGVVERLVSRLNRVEREKESATLRLKGMEERVSRLEKELSEKIHLQLHTEERQEDETSSDGGIESGTEPDDLSEK